MVNGIPQGSPISPMLSIIYAIQIYEEYHARLSARYTLRASPVGKITPTAIASYIDDVDLDVSSTNLQYNTIALRVDFITVLRILTGLGLSVDFGKCELTHFTRSHITFPDITRLPGPDRDVHISHRNGSASLSTQNYCSTTT